MKNIQLKLTVILMFIGSVLLSIESIINMYYLSKIKNQLTSYDIMQTINKDINILGIIWLSVMVVFAICAFIFVSNVLKIITKPFSNIVDNANKFENDEKNEIKYLDEGKKSAEDKFSKAINIMAEELKQNLNDVNKQKNQTEAILLHIKDGIISFDLDGNVTYINQEEFNFFEL